MALQNYLLKRFSQSLHKTPNVYCQCRQASLTFTHAPAPLLKSNETKLYSSLTSPTLKVLRIMAFQHAETYTTFPNLLSGIMQMRTVFSEALPALLSCIFHANVQHIVKCKKSIPIDSSWNGAIAFQIYKGNETGRFLRDTQFTVRLFYLKIQLLFLFLLPNYFFPSSFHYKQRLPTKAPFDHSGHVFNCYYLLQKH